MINPGGSPGTSFSKSAQTRFNNGQINAQRAAMPMNQAAQQSLRNMKSGGKPSGPAISAPPDTNLLTPGSVQSQQPPVGSMPQPQLPSVTPEDATSIKNTILDDLVANVRRQQFINSPQVKDAMTSIRLKNIFNATNPDAMPDDRDLMGRIKARIGEV